MFPDFILDAKWLAANGFASLLISVCPIMFLAMYADLGLKERYNLEGGDPDAGWKFTALVFYRAFFKPTRYCGYGKGSAESTPGFLSYYAGSALLLLTALAYGAAALGVLLLLGAGLLSLGLLNPWLLVIPAVPFVAATVLSFGRIEFRVVVLEKKVIDQSKEQARREAENFRRGG